jgi:hypothetical protein
VRRMISLAVVSLAVLAAVPFVPIGPLGSWIVSAHPGLHLPSPPSHDYDTVTPGTQGPTALVLANPTGHLFSAHRLNVTVMVPIEDVQNILPPGFSANALPPPNPPGMAGLGLSFDFLGQCDRVGAGPSGSASGMYVLHGARNTALGRNEQVVLAGEFNEQSFIDCHRALLGPGGSRLADVEAEFEQKEGQLQIKYNVEDEEIGLRVKIRAQGAAAFTARNQHGDPAPAPLRTLDQGLFVNPAHRFSVMADAVGILITDTNFQLTLGRSREAAENGTLGRLGLPGGSVRVAGVAAAFPGFPPLFLHSRWFENFVQPE